MGTKERLEKAKNELKHAKDNRNSMRDKIKRHEGELILLNEEVKFLEDLYIYLVEKANNT